MSDIEEIDDDHIMTPEGIAQYAHALIAVQRKEQMPIMEEIKEKQEYFSSDDDEKELFRQIISGYIFTVDDCMPELDECYMQLAVKKSEAGVGYDMSCTFCRERLGKIYWFNIAPADYFMIIQIVGNYKPSVMHTFANYYFFKDDIVEIVDNIIGSQLQVKTSRKKIKILK